jgi:hypothetical protein
MPMVESKCEGSIGQIWHVRHTVASNQTSLRGEALQFEIVVLVCLHELAGYTREEDSVVEYWVAAGF